MRWAAAAGAGLLLGLILTWALLDLRADLVAERMALLRSLWWGPLAALLLFVLLALAGAPQVVLIGAMVLGYGALPGAGLAWGASMVSALIGYGLGRWGGAAARLRAPQGGWLVGLQRVMRRRAVWAAFLVRSVPTGPAILVNMAFGAAGVRLRAFALGTGLGIVPKIAVIAGFGRGLTAWLSGREVWVGWAAVAAAALLALGARWLAVRSRSALRMDAAECAVTPCQASEERALRQGSFTPHDAGAGCGRSCARCNAR
jgi:uncharacterized membrane protein YdjX (TVP38/TMEM64 family)